MVLLGAACALYGAMNSDPPVSEDVEGATFPEILLQLMQVGL